MRWPIESFLSLCIKHLDGSLKLRRRREDDVKGTGEQSTLQLEAARLFTQGF
jgi:hypothetical protein